MTENVEDGRELAQIDTNSVPTDEHAAGSLTNICEWSTAESEWQTDCGHFVPYANFQSPLEFGFEFCGFCGKKLNEIIETIQVQEHEYTFDVKYFASITVNNPTLKKARATLEKMLASAELRMWTGSEADPVTAAVSVDGEHDLTEHDENGYTFDVMNFSSIKVAGPTLKSARATLEKMLASAELTMWQGNKADPITVGVGIDGERELTEIDGEDVPYEDSDAEE